MTLAEELLLAAINPRTRRIRPIEQIGFALRGAELLDLAFAARITVRTREITVTDATPLGHPGSDRALAELRDRTPAPSTSDWLRSRPPEPGLIRQYLTVLEEQSAIRVEQRGAGADLRTRIFVVDDARRGGVLARIDLVARDGSRPGSRPGSRATAQDEALAALVHGCGLDRYLDHGPLRRRTRRRLGRLAEAATAAAATSATRAGRSPDDAEAVTVWELARLIERGYRDELRRQVIAPNRSNSVLNPGVAGAGNPGGPYGGHHGGFSGGGHGGGVGGGHHG